MATTVTHRKGPRRVGFIEFVYRGLNAPKTMATLVFVGALSFIASALAGNALYDALTLLPALTTAARIILAFLPFGVLVLCLYAVGRSLPDRAATSLGLFPVTAKTALVANLSAPFKAFHPQGPCQTLDEVSQLATDLASRADSVVDAQRAHEFSVARREFWARVAGTNFGPLVLALLAHEGELRVLKLCTTDRSGGHYPKYADAIRRLWPDLRVMPVPLGDATNVKAMVATLAEEFDRMLSARIGEDGKVLAIGDVAVDFTGGTAAMSAAMNIAALDERFCLEYVVQAEGFDLFDPATGLGLDSEELVRRRVIVEVQTGLSDVPLIRSEGTP